MSAKSAALLIGFMLTGAGCFRLTDPIYAFKDIQAPEPSHEGSSLLLGTIVVDEALAGDLNSVSLERLGKEPHYYGANRTNLFRAFFPRVMKDGHFIIQVDPGVYELSSFSTSGWGQPRVWNARGDARKGTRIVVTRPGVYDLGVIRVESASMLGNTYSMDRIADGGFERQQVFAKAIAGTPWEKMAAAPAPAANGAATTPP